MSLLPRTDGVATKRSPVSVVIPCRDEANNLAELLPNLYSVLQADDQVIVVDDGSSDDTTSVARNHRAGRNIANEINIEVVESGALPIGWAGKPHACWRGVQYAIHDIVVFLDADVRLGTDAVNATVGALQQHPDALVSVMPWHRTVTRVERLSMLFN
ncbi:MAG: glycosyltransferase family 2 protein, partial [Ilumatobacteraceae bacterium]|nr:glycosyltransferase family 2 protein [Ilumatobacteraceae bacterium]